MKVYLCDQMFCSSCFLHYWNKSKWQLRIKYVSNKVIKSNCLLHFLKNKIYSETVQLTILLTKIRLVTFIIKKKNQPSFRKKGLEGKGGSLELNLKIFIVKLKPHQLYKQVWETHQLSYLYQRVGRTFRRAGGNFFLRQGDIFFIVKRT